MCLICLGFYCTTGLRLRFALAFSFVRLLLSGPCFCACQSSVWLAPVPWAVRVIA